MKMTKIVLMSALASCALISGCKDDKPSNVTIEFMHSSVEQERQAVITKLIEKFEKENPTITVKQVPVEEDAYNTKVITLARTGALPEVIEVSHDYAKVMDKEQLLDRDAIGEAIKAVGEDTFYDGILRVVRTEDGTAWTGVPVSAWLSGVWYHKDILAAAGIEEPHNWEQLLQASQKLNDPGKKHYGIALPTAESVMTEQAFSQFALSGGANVFDAKGDVEIDTPEMTKALAFYKALAAAHDERSSIAAKGLTGEGYKGHIFWDTEIFLLPFHLFTRPQIARNLLRYRWLNLSGAREKARRNGWPGALFPWESAASGQEETPEFAAINIRTGTRQKVASALAEHHIVADIAWAVVAYWQATRDDAFMRNEGLTLLTETATFWMGRAVEVNGRLEIHDVIGPDEYTEHVNNNAYTNYLAWHNVACARQFMTMFGRDDDAFLANATRFLTRLWLPEANAEGVLPQDDTFMAKPAIDLSRYKAKAGKQTILLDYSRAEVNEMQILKQADVVMLNYLLPERFTPQQCAANLAFYEPRTIHDSSLSKAIHGIVTARCGDTEGAYVLWRDGVAIDLGDDPRSSDDGIHAAATGAIWSGVIQGFAGVQIVEGELHLAPKLPAHWRKLSFPLRWRNAQMRFCFEHDALTVESSAPVTLTLWGKTLNVSGLQIFARKDFLAPIIGTATTEGRYDA